MLGVLQLIAIHDSFIEHNIWNTCSSNGDALKIHKTLVANFWWRTIGDTCINKYLLS